MSTQGLLLSKEPSTAAESPQEDDGSSTNKRASTSIQEWKPSKQIWLVIAGQICVVFVVALDSTILTLSLPTVAHALRANSVNAFWIVTSYLLANATVQPLMAALADIFGRRATFFGSLLCFTAGTIVCCTAHGVPQILVGRTIQGIGGGGVLSINLIILSDMIPLRQRSKYVGLVQLIASLAINFGPIIGGALIKASWRWLFYINFPFCGLGLAIIPFLLRYVRPETTFYHKLSQVDWTGAFIFMTGATAFLIGVSWGGNQFTWASAATLVPLVLGIAIVAGSIAYERFVARNPFLRLSLFQTRSAVAAYVCNVLASLTLYAEVYFINLYLLTVKGYTPIISGVAFLAFALAVVPVSGITGALITKVGAYRWGVLFGWIFNTCGLGALMVLAHGTYVPGMVFIFLMAGIGQGMLFMAHQIATQASAKTKDVAYANAMFSFTRSLGLCLGVAIAGTVFQNFLRHHLVAVGLPVSIATDAEAFASVLKAMPDTSNKQAIIVAFEYAFRHLWATMCGISGFGLVVSFLIQEHDLDVEHDSTHKLRSKEDLRFE